MKILATWHDNYLMFGHFFIKKDKEKMYGVYSRSANPRLITSDETLKGAAKKAKYLEIGYLLGYDDGENDCEEWHRLANS